MTGAAWPAGDVRLERWYRRLLLAYPGHYRRRHGTEILTTMLEAAEPGRRRPVPAEAADLLLGGLRQRLRLPSRRPFALMAAVLATVALGAFGAAAGSWAGERTLPALPSEREASALVSDLTGGIVEPWMGTYGRPYHAPVLHGGTGSYPGDPLTTAGWRAEQARDRLAADGWTITRFGVSSLPVTGPGRNGYLSAARDGVVFESRWTSDMNADLSVDIFARRSGAYLPITVAGGLLGAVTGWLLAAWGAYRMRVLPILRRKVAARLAGLAFAWSALPVVVLGGAAARLVLRHLGDDRMPVFSLHAPLYPGVPFQQLRTSWMPIELTLRLVPGSALAAALCAVAALAVMAGRTTAVPGLLPGAAQPAEQG
ncbi:hypothetical protein AB0368_08455 [Actinoplanes sp. NPDC051475]|uniref:hypothetical protein n=1 Tax=Actinoplanes sp. NPDC051475 TaxID=3157225 RepID=UPI00344E92FE